MNSRDERDLSIWQSHRHLSPAERMERILRDAMLPYVSPEAYADLLEQVSTEMRAA